MTEDPWDQPATAAAYRAFAKRHDRYRRVSAALARVADLDGARTVLDVGAGTGVTTRAVLRRVGADARVVAVEPSASMRAASTVRDGRVRWVDRPPDGTFDAVLCSAAAWLLGPLDAVLVDLAQRVAPGGCLAWSVPAGFVGRPDGAPDDRPAALDALVAAFIAERTQAPEPGRALPSADAVAAALASAGWQVEEHTVEVRWTWAAWRDWLALPPVGLAMRPDLTIATLPAAVQRAVDAAGGPRRGHRTERWVLGVAR